MKAKKAQAEGFGALPAVGRIILLVALLIVVLLFLGKAAEWMGFWEVPW